MRIVHRAKSVLLPRPGPRTLPLGLGRGIRMHIDFAVQTRTYLGLYEVELNRFLRQILTAGVATFDVGAQAGYDSLVIAKRTRARVAAFECDADCLLAMKASFRLNPDLAPLIEPVDAVVGADPGQTGLDDWAYGGGFVPDFIKLDIDGGELAALRSAERLLAERKPALLVEVHSLDLERGCGSLLIEHGYRPVVVNQRRVWPDYRPIPHNRWLCAAA